MTVDEKGISMLLEKGHLTPAKIKKKLLKKTGQINNILIKRTQNSFFFTLTHYNASHDHGRKRPVCCGKRTPTHLQREKYNN